MNGEDEWFKYWFDSPYYDLLYSNRNEQEAMHFIDNLLAYLHPAPKANMLDLACGTGRHSIYLAEKGYEVTGVDLSHRSIMQARKAERPGLEFYEHDIRQYFRINYYDYIFNFFTSFGYFDSDKDNLKVLRAANLGLAAKGILVIDFMNALMVCETLVKEMDKEVGGIVFHIKKWADGKFIYKDIRFNDKGKDYHFHERVQLLTLDDFKQYLSKTGFTLRATFGNYDLAPYNEATSDRLILIAEK